MNQYPDYTLVKLTGEILPEIRVKKTGNRVDVEGELWWEKEVELVNKKGVREKVRLADLMYKKCYLRVPHEELIEVEGMDKEEKIHDSPSPILYIVEYNAETHYCESKQEVCLLMGITHKVFQYLLHGGWKHNNLKITSKPIYFSPIANGVVVVDSEFKTKEEVREYMNKKHFNSVYEIKKFIKL